MTNAPHPRPDPVGNDMNNRAPVPYGVKSPAVRALIPGEVLPAVDVTSRGRLFSHRPPHGAGRTFLGALDGAASLAVLAALRAPNGAVGDSRTMGIFGYCRVDAAAK